MVKFCKSGNREKEIKGIEAKGTLEINYYKAAADAINKVKQDLASKEIEQRLIQEKEKLQKGETLSGVRTEPELSDALKIRSNCKTLKMETGKPIGITKIGSRILSIISVAGHKVMRNLSEPSDQTLMYIDVYSD